MSRKIAIESPLQSEHAAAWQDLGAFDPTRLSVEHEWNLVQDLGRSGAQMVLVFQGEKPVLRFLLHRLLPEAGTACLGFFGLDPGTPLVFLREAFQLALQQLITPSLRKLVGPMNGSTWFSYRLRTDQHPLQFDWEPRAQPRLEKILEASGFQVSAHYHTIATAGRQSMQASTKKDGARVMERGYSIRLLGPEDLKSGALVDLHRLSQLGFADNPLFAPLSFEAFARSYVQGKTSKENFISMAYDASGRAVGFFLAFLEPAHGEEQQKTLVLKTIAIDPAHRRQGLSNALIHALCRELPAAVSDHYISALVLQGGASEVYARHGQKVWEHQYVLLAKDLL